MVQINFARKEVNCKIVFYGPGMSGKTTNLEKVFENAPEDHKGELTSIATEGDRTLFFDFLPLDLGTVAGMNTKFQLYTVPGQVYYNSTRKLVLQGADGVIFVADSQRKKLDENIESLDNLIDNLEEYGIGLHDIPIVLQWNKRDMPDVMSVEELNEKINPHGWPNYEAIAVTGEGVFPTLKALSALVLENLNKDLTDSDNAPEPAKPAAKQAAQPAPAAQKPAAAPAQKHAPDPASAPQKPAQAPQKPAQAPQKPAPAPHKPAPVQSPPPKPPPPKSTTSTPAQGPRSSAPRTPKPPPMPAKQNSRNLIIVIVLLLSLAAAAAVAVVMAS